ncbi:MAG TPA: cyclodeaminase/cyclohydrolase family protein [Solirubrobacteraceae bacterium]|nr:cyclodeaminase/cyclohydrolase family protein [Solirubrobacteraceae bacterium]
MSGTPRSERLSDLPFGEVLARVAARTPAPGGGTTAALVCSLAAALVEMAAGFEAGPQAEERRARAAAMGSRALELADADLTSYEPVLQALRRPAGDAERAAALAAALSEAAGTPMGIAELGAEVAALAQGAADAGSRHLLGDCATAALLAEGACRAAAVLVEINLHGTTDPRRTEAQALVRAADVSGRHVQSRACMEADVDG